MINLKDVKIGSKIYHNGNELTVTDITQEHTHKGAWMAKTVVCSCNIKTNRGTQVCFFIPFVYHLYDFYSSNEFTHETISKN